MKLRILYRQVFDIAPNLFSEFLKLEEEMLYAEEKYGYPEPRKYRPLASYKDCGTRIYERVFESISDFSRLISKRYLDKDFAKLDARRFKLVNWTRNELYYVDSGSPVPAWMQGISSQPFSEELIKQGLPMNDSWICKRDAGEIGVMYRQIQCVPKSCWGEKFEQELRSDKVEFEQGNPLPIRLRSMFGPENSHIRVSEREYPSYEKLCHIHESFINEDSVLDSRVMDAEARRQAFFAWEKEELYFVD